MTTTTMTTTTSRRRSAVGGQELSEAWRAAAAAATGGRREGRRGSVGNAIIDAMVPASGCEAPGFVSPAADQQHQHGSSTWAKMRRGSVFIQSLNTAGADKAREARRSAQREVDRMIEGNNKILRALEEEAIARTLGRERKSAMDGPFRRGSLGSGQVQEARLGRRSSFTVVPDQQGGGARAGRRGSLGQSANREFMDLIKDKEQHIQEQHTTEINPLRPGFTEPAAMPMWRGYSVLEKDDHTVRGGTISAGAAQDAGATRTGSPNTAGGYGCKTVKQEINLAPTHLGGPRFGRRKSSVTEQLAEGMEEIGKARGRLSQRSQEIKQNRRESFGRLLTMPKAPGWLSAERNYRRTSSSSSTELRQQTKPKTPTREEVEREERRAREMSSLKRRLRFPDIKKLLYSRPWYLRSDF